MTVTVLEPTEKQRSKWRHVSRGRLLSVPERAEIALLAEADEMYSRPIYKITVSLRAGITKAIRREQYRARSMEAAEAVAADIFRPPRD